MEDLLAVSMDSWECLAVFTFPLALSHPKEETEFLLCRLHTPGWASTWSLNLVVKIFPSMRKKPNNKSKKPKTSWIRTKCLLVRDRSVENVIPRGPDGLLSFHFCPLWQCIWCVDSKRREAEEQSGGSVKYREIVLAWLGLLTAQFVFYGIPWDSHTWHPVTVEQGHFLWHLHSCSNGTLTELERRRMVSTTLCCCGYILT